MFLFQLKNLVLVCEKSYYMMSVLSVCCHLIKFPDVG